MAGGVGEALLGDAIERGLQFIGQARGRCHARNVGIFAWIGAEIEARIERKALASVSSKSAESRGESCVIEQRRAKLAREGLDLAEGVLGQGGEAGGARGGGVVTSGSGEALAESFGVQCEGGKTLANLVVKLQGDLAALSFMGA